MTRRGLWVAVIVGAALFAALVVWLYTLIGYAVVIPLLVAAVAYIEIRLSGISEQLDELLDVEQHGQAPLLLCMTKLPIEDGDQWPCRYPLGHRGEWHRAADGMMWREIGRTGTEYRPHG